MLTTASRTSSRRTDTHPLPRPFSLPPHHSAMMASKSRVTLGTRRSVPSTRSSSRSSSRLREAAPSWCSRSPRYAHAHTLDPPRPRLVPPGCAVLTEWHPALSAVAAHARPTGSPKNRDAVGGAKGGGGLRHHGGSNLAAADTLPGSSELLTGSPAARPFPAHPCPTHPAPGRNEAVSAVVSRCLPLPAPGSRHCPAPCFLDRSCRPERAQDLWPHLGRP